MLKDGSYWFRQAAVLAVSGLLLSTATRALAADSKSQNYTIQSAYFGQTAFVQTTSLGPPEVLSTGPALSNLTDSSVTITWKTSQESTSMIQYGKSALFGTETGDSTRYTADHTVTLIGLEPETLYYYRVKSVNTEGVIGNSEGRSFTTTAKRGISSISVTDITYTTALISWQTGDATKNELQYGPTTSYGSTISGKSLSYTTSHTEKLDKLTSGATYHFRIVATSESGTTDRSTDLSFQTIADPVISGIMTKQTNPHEMQIIWRTNSATSAIVRYNEKGKTRQSSLGAAELTVEHTAVATDLIDNTTYLYKITATDGQGKQITSPEQTFTTSKDNSPPAINNLRVVVNRSGDDLVLTATWKTNKLVIGQGLITEKNNPSQKMELPPEPIATTNHILVKAGLSPSTLYTFKAIATDTYGNTQTSEVNFITPSVRKGILGLIADSFNQTFGWLNQAMGKDK